MSGSQSNLEMISKIEVNLESGHYKFKPEPHADNAFPQSESMANSQRASTAFR